LAPALRLRPPHRKCLNQQLKLYGRNVYSMYICICIHMHISPGYPKLFL
jgi:hypothetical protein